ncbi:hypothetical protein D6783_04250, partial [Candidatus Woesearchaeota archaeon]
KQKKKENHQDKKKREHQQMNTNKANLETIVLEKPQRFTGLNEESATAYLLGIQRGARALKKEIIDQGDEQLKTLARQATGYHNDNLPPTSPYRTSIKLDNITFPYCINIKITTPSYSAALQRIYGFLETTIEDLREGIRKDNVRKLDGEPYIDTAYLLSRCIGHISRQQHLGLEIKRDKDFPSVTSPNRLLIPLHYLTNGFTITTPGAARFWLTAEDFYNDIKNNTLQRFEKAVEEHAAQAAKEPLPNETLRGWLQISNYAFAVTRVPQRVRSIGKTLDQLFKIPTPPPKEENARPVIITPQNYEDLLKERRPFIDQTITRSKDLNGKLGEIIAIHLGLHHDDTCTAKLPFIPHYDPREQGNKIYIALQTLYDRLRSLEENLKGARTLDYHSAHPIA